MAKPRLAGLDGLRAIAVIAVIVFHLGNGLLPGGFIGVDVFFVISGFLITTLLLREHGETGHIRVRSFWARRARRLLPALALVVLASSTAALVIGGDVLVGIGRQVLGAATFSYNWLAVASESSYFDSITPELFRNLWSLAVEEQFYLLWPFAVLLLVLLRRRALMAAGIALLALLSVTTMLVLPSMGATATRLYYGTDTHSFGLSLGAVLAVASARWSPRALEWRRLPRRVVVALGALALLGIAAVAALMAEDSPLVFTGGLPLVAVLTALAIAGSTVAESPLGRLLDLRPLAWVGERSYGLYLWHWPVFILAGAAMPDANPWLLGATALVVTVVAATLSYRYVEQPVRRRGARAVAREWIAAWRSGARRTATAAVGTAAVLALLAATLAAVATAPATGLAQERIEAGQAAIDDHAAPQSAPTGDAVGAQPAALPGGDQIYAIGDSVMLAAADEVIATFPGIAVDAAVNRRMSDAPAIVQSLIDTGTLRPILLLGLGTNGPVDQASIDAVSALVGYRTEIVLVNAQAPRGWIPGVNALLAQYAQSHRNVELANWFEAIAPRLDVLARDKIHAGGPIGGTIYAGAIRDALQRLAELPPLLNSNDYGLAPRPV